MSNTVVIRRAGKQDVSAMNTIEGRCFHKDDRLSRQRFVHYTTAKSAVLLVAEVSDQVVGYGLVLFRRGTLLCRLYSLAVDQSARGQGIAERLIGELAECAVNEGKRFMRLEVSTSNAGAIRLYERLKFVPFGRYEHYYADNTDALRMQLTLLPAHPKTPMLTIPWYQQTTDFTCGAASLMMALATVLPDYTMSQSVELSIWRRATTIFMTSGHGGSHPFGLALSALEAGAQVEVMLNQPLPLFTEGVRTEHKKQIIGLVEEQFAEEVAAAGIVVSETEWSLDCLSDIQQKGGVALCLISMYQLTREKAPHWVVVTALDSNCVYIHDPDLDRSGLDLQQIPIDRDEFLRVACYGTRKLRTLVAVYPPEHLNSSV